MTTETLTNIVYMSLSSSFPPFPPGTIEHHGLGAMEIIAMDMKRSGMFLARSLSFRACTFKVLNDPLEQSIKETYDKSAKFWQKLYAAFKEAVGACTSAHSQGNI